MTESAAVALPPKGRSALLLMYYQHLRTKHPHFRCATLKCYLREAASLFTQAGLPDPRCSESDVASPTDSLLPRFSKIFKLQQNWETMESRQDPLTREMASWLLLHTAELPTSSVERSTANWIALGLSTGFRISEYAQSSPKVKLLPQNQSFKGLPQAFILNDFTFHQSARTPPLPPSHYAKATLVRIRWRKQKNAQNGETIDFAAIPNNSSPNSLCPVANAIEIVQRARFIAHPLRLLGIHSSDTLRSSHITSSLRQAARHAHGLTDASDRHRFTPHSIRVGACVLLHEMGASSSFLQKRLRWKSQAFESYLRNTDVLASQHARFLSQTVPSSLSPASADSP